MLNIVEQGDRFDLRIDNQPFSNLYLAEKNKTSFKHEDEGFHAELVDKPASYQYIFRSNS